MKFKAKEVFLLPNLLTYFRILCVPIFVWLMLDANIKFGQYFALGVFAIATITDVLDGKIARKFNMVSDIGKILDPIADKALQISTLITLAITNKVHWAFVAILLAKELYMIIGGTVILRVFKSDYTIEANWGGKLGTLVNSIAIIVAFFHEPQWHNLYYIDWAILGLGCIIAIFGAFQYSKSFFDYHKAQKSAIANKSDEDSSAENVSENVDKDTK